jgi:hypothetical protein
VRALVVPLALAAALALEVVLVRRALGPVPREAAGATPAELHVLANRGSAPLALDAAAVEALLHSPDPLVRDLAMTWDGTRAAGDELQRAALEAQTDPAEQAIGRFLLRYQVRSPDLEALAAFRAAVRRRRVVD